MKKICEIIMIAVMMSYMCIYSASADGGYVLSKGLIIGSKMWKITDYCGAPYGEYKDMIDEVLEEEKCANYCMLYFSIADEEDEAFVMLAGKNELGEEEITLWNTEIGFADSLVWYAKILGVYDSFLIKRHRNLAGAYYGSLWKNAQEKKKPCHTEFP